MIEAMLEYPFIIFHVFLNKKETIFLAPIEIACIFDAIFEADFYAIAMFNSVDKLAVIQLFIKIVDDALVLSIFQGILAKVNAVLILLDDGLVDINGEVCNHVLKVANVLVVRHAFI